ncbi:MAG: class II fumarate hydratase [Rhodospirillales bacterium]|nr:class II fumarate hydratase [Rhodospirillales bacterium]
MHQGARRMTTPIGIEATGTREERDAMGALAVPADRYWGAQTQRSLTYFSIGDERMPLGVVHALALAKRAAARVNAAAGRLAAPLARAIEQAAAEAERGELDAHFPLHVWQTGSGTQTNMNVNEVLANRANRLLGAPLGARTPVHPNDHVNLGQSSNDIFPTAMHIATLAALEEQVLPAAQALADAIAAKAQQWSDVVKIGRTHLQDAVPLTVGQEWGGHAAQIRAACARLRAAGSGLLELAAGGTAVGTGLNAPPGFGPAIAAEIAALTGRPFVSAPDKFAALAGLDAMLAAMAALRGLATVLLKVANDIRLLASGPRSGLGELLLPQNEPGSSIMPGKVNPTQSEAMVMVCTQILGLDAAVAFAAAQGQLQLNVMRPLVIANVLAACRLLADAATSFRRFCIEGTELDRRRIAELLDRSLMLVTALAPEIGYDRAAAIAHAAHTNGTTLREAALASGAISAERFDALVDPRKMVGGT